MTDRRKLRGRALAAVVGAALASAPAAAQPAGHLDDPVALHQRGRELAKAWRQDHEPAKLEEAAALFKQSLAITDSPLVECDLGLALHYLGHTARAQARLARCLPRLTAADPAQVARYQPVADEVAAAARATLVALELDSEPGGAVVSISSFPADETVQVPAVVWLAPGEHTLIARAPGRVDARWTVALGVDAVGRPARTWRPTLAVAPVVMPDRPAPARSRRSRTPAYVALGAGGLLLAGGVTVHLLSRDVRADLAASSGAAYDRLLPTWHRYQYGTVGLYAGAVVATAVGGLLWRRSAGRPAVAVAPVTAGATLSLSFTVP